MTVISVNLFLLYQVTLQEKDMNLMKEQYKHQLHILHEPEFMTMEDGDDDDAYNATCPSASVMSIRCPPPLPTPTQMEDNHNDTHNPLSG